MVKAVGGPDRPVWATKSASLPHRLSAEPWFIYPYMADAILGIYVTFLGVDWMIKVLGNRTVDAAIRATCHAEKA